MWLYIGKISFDLFLFCNYFFKSSFFIYYHLLDFNVSIGDVVTQDTIIGWVGGWSTSTEHGGYDNCTTGSHLHYGVAKGYYNPSTGIVRSNVITPPGFPNSKGYSFYSRTDMWNG